MSGLTKRGFKELSLQNVKSEPLITCDLPVADGKQSSPAGEVGGLCVCVCVCFLHVQKHARPLQCEVLHCLQTNSHCSSGAASSSAELEVRQ